MGQLTAVNWDKEFTKEGHRLAKLQAKLFEVCEIEFKRDAKDFVEKFMTDYAYRLDTGIFYGDYKQLGEAFLSDVDVRDLRGTKVFNLESLFWLGYLYRYWAWLEVPSKEIIKIAPFDKVLERYVWHTLDIEDVIQMFYEEFKA